MIPRKLQLHNVASFRGDHEIDLGTNPLMALIGVNGAGKSTLIDAIPWVLFGDWRGSLADDVIARGERECRASLEFDLDGDHYRTERVRRARGKAELHFQLAHGDGWRALDGESIADTQARICQRLRMTGDLLRQTAFIGQEQAGLFSRATPADRKQVLFGILGLDRYEALLAEVRTRLAINGTETAGLEARMAAESERASDAARAHQAVAELGEQVKQTEVEVAQAEGELAAARTHANEMRASVTRLEAIEALRKHALGEVEAARKRVAETEDLIVANRLRLERMDSQSLRESAARVADLTTEEAEADAAHQALSDAQRRLREAQTNLDSETRAHESRRQAREALLAEHQRQAELVDQVPCAGTDLGPRCQLLAGARKARVAAGSLEAELSSDDEAFQAADKSRRAAVALARKAAANAEVNVSNRRPVTTIRDELAAGRQAADQLADVKAIEVRLEEQRTRREQLMSDLAAADGAVQVRTAECRQAFEAAGAQDFAGVRALQTEAEQAEWAAGAELSGLNDRLGARQRALAVEQERLAQAEAAAGIVARLQEHLKSGRRTRHLLELLDGAFGRNGIPALLLERAIPEIEDHANEVLELLSDGRLRVRLDTQRAKVSGDLAETLAVTIIDDAVERDYATFSGGERMRIDLGLRIGLSRLLALRAGAAFDTLVLDETVAPLDAEGRATTVECLARLQGTFACIILVTHDESLRDAFPAVIAVERTAQGSRIEVVVA